MKPKHSININMKPPKILKDEKFFFNFSKENQAFIRNLTRKYTYNPKMFIPNFVPVLRPIHNDSIIPSKLILNNKKRNSSTISNPSSEDLDDFDNEEFNLRESFEDLNLSESSSDSENEENKEINDIRKNFKKIRKCSILRNKSKKTNDKNFGKMYLNNEIINNEKSDLYLDNNIDQSDFSLENKKLFLMPKKSIGTLSSLIDNENIIINEHLKKPKLSMNSNSILETLQNKFNFNLEK